MGYGPELTAIGAVLIVIGLFTLAITNMIGV